ncbi:hypothetical protein BY996DRAFT_8191267 [Phakopsora pachyrhizi]|nr:hypothetical protein BY996DRAFT_8191267 [Phakopsora pachyrhizi]
MNEQHQRFPKTPLKRISRNSLRAPSVSNINDLTKSGGEILFSSSPDHNQNDDRDDGHRSNLKTNHPKPLSSSSSSSTAEPLDNLSELFSDLADSVTDLSTNLLNLDRVCQDLDGFNHSFSSFLYGLRISSYVTEFEEAPKLDSFEFSKYLQRKKPQQDQDEFESYLSKNFKDLIPDEANSTIRNESCIEASILQNSTAIHSTSSSKLQGEQLTSETRIKETDTLRKRSNDKISDQIHKTFTKSSRLQQRQLLKFCEPILECLPIKFREQQPHRREMEFVISCLRLNSNSSRGLQIKEIVRLEPSLALHRVRECCTTLFNSKKATKINTDAGISYKLSL